MALESATRSWLARDRRRTLRPIHMVGSTTINTAASAADITTGLVHTSMASAPRPSTALRRPSENDEPMTVCTKVVSAVRRESTSPVCVVSKKAGLCVSTWA